MIITALNLDDFYIEQLIVLLTSLKINSPNDKVNVFLINFDTHTTNTIKSIFSEVNFENRTLDLKNDPAGTMVCYRGIVVRELLESTKAPVAWFDTDIIVRGDLKSFWEKVKTNQLQIKYRGEDVAPKSRFNAGIFAIGYSPATLDYIIEWCDVINKNSKWYEDQLQLYLLYKKYQDRIELIDAPQSFNDIGDSNSNDIFKDDSLIWHCKKSHFYNEKYRNEHLKYLGIAKGDY